MPSRLLTTVMSVALLLLAAPRPAMAEAAPVEMWRTSGCACCGKWATHMQSAGHAVKINDTASGVLAKIKLQAGITETLAACHTAKIGGYVIEGHVPAEDVKRLLAERPDAIGLAVPGMPLGSPGMEAGDDKEPYEVLLVKKDGGTEVWAKH